MKVGWATITRPMTREERLAAMAAIEAMSGGTFVPPDELNRIVEEERLQVDGLPFS
jgi:hypothetical protein